MEQRTVNPRSGLGIEVRRRGNGARGIEEDADLLTTASTDYEDEQS